MLVLDDRRIIELDYIRIEKEEQDVAHLWSCRDVSQRERTQQLVEQRRKQLDTVFELSPDGLVYFNEEQVATSINSSFQHLTGIELSKAIGVPRQEFFALIERECAASEIHMQDDHRYIVTTRHPRQSVLMVYERGLHQDDQSSERVLYVRDITHEYEVDKMKSDFLATAAHELRTPLSSVYGFSELLLETEQSPAVQREMLETIHRQSGHLNHMLNELLDLARIEARAGQDFDIHLHPLKPVLLEICCAFVPAQKNRKLLWKLPSVMPKVKMDSNKFRQLMDNILSNAFKYSEGVADVELNATFNEEVVTIDVRDYGIGMTEEQVSHIFERFYRAEKSGQVPGSGLGMSLVKEIVTILGWSVSIDSELGQGTRVTLSIPIAISH